MSGRILIVGGGEAGVSVAITLRELGYPGEVVIACGEDHLPYQRPPLSKEYLADGADLDDLALRAPEFFAEHDIEVRLGHRVTKLTVADDGGVAVFDDHTEIGFDALALTTGSTSRALPIAGADLSGVLSLRTRDDAAALRAALAAANDVVVIGGGFIGLEVAATAHKQGARVTVVEATDRPMARVVSAPVSEFVAEHHRAQGIRILTDTSVAELGGADGRVQEVTLADGSTLPADLVIVGVGADPVIGPAAELGLECGRGIVVDAAARTSHPLVVAAGDCASAPHPHLDGHLSVESVNNAVEQGRIAAHTLLGQAAEDPGAPWFWSNQGELKIQIAGISDGFDQSVLRGDDDRLTVLYYRSGRLIAADTVNNPRDHMAVKRALGNGHTIDPEAATDTATPLKKVVTP